MNTQEYLIGHIFKNKRHHPDRVFLVRTVKKVRVKTKIKSATKKDIFTFRLHGIYIADDVPPEERSYLWADFQQEFGLVMWAPAPGEGDPK